MNVTCPNCATVYRVDPAKVPPAGVRARCAVCSAVFPVRHESEPAVAPAEPTPVPPAVEAVRAPEPPRQTANAERSVAPPATPTAPAAAPAFTPPAVRAPAAPPLAPPVSGPPSVAVPSAPTPPDSAPARPAGPPRPVAPPAFAGVSRPAPSAAPTPMPEPARPVLPTPPAAPAAPAAPAPAAPPRPVNPFLSQDPALKARRLARALISDMVVYHPAKRQEGLRDGTLKELFQDEIKKSWEEYREQVGRDVAESSPYFREALNEILAGGKQIF